MDLNVDVDQTDGVTVVTVAGEVDLHTAPTLRQRLDEALQSGHHDLVVDLERVEFFDSTGLGVVIRASETAKQQGGSLQLVCTRPAVLRVFEVTGLTDVLAIHESRAQALSSGTPSGRD